MENQLITVENSESVIFFVPSTSLKDFFLAFFIWMWKVELKKEKFSLFRNEIEEKKIEKGVQNLLKIVSVII